MRPSNGPAEHGIKSVPTSPSFRHRFRRPTDPPATPQLSITEDLTAPAEGIVLPENERPPPELEPGGGRLEWCLNGPESNLRLVGLGICLYRFENQLLLALGAHYPGGITRLHVAAKQCFGQRILEITLHRAAHWTRSIGGIVAFGY